jgi:hypothetical protein
MNRRKFLKISAIVPIFVLNAKEALSYFSHTEPIRDIKYYKTHREEFVREILEVNLNEWQLREFRHYYRPRGHNIVNLYKPGPRCGATLLLAVIMLTEATLNEGYKICTIAPIYRQTRTDVFSKILDLAGKKSYKKFANKNSLTPAVNPRQSRECKFALLKKREHEKEYWCYGEGEIWSEITGEDLVRSGSNIKGKSYHQVCADDYDHIDRESYEHYETIINWYSPWPNVKEVKVRTENAYFRKS